MCQNSFSEKAFLKPPELRPRGQENGGPVFAALWGMPKSPSAHEGDQDYIKGNADTQRRSKAIELMLKL